MINPYDRQMQSTRRHFFGRSATGIGTAALRFASQSAALRRDAHRRNFPRRSRRDFEIDPF